MTDQVKDKDFLEFIVKSLVDNPTAVKVDRIVDEMGVLLTLKLSPEDMGKIIGRRGSTAQAIRMLLKAVGLKNRARINFKIEEPEGAIKTSRKSSSSQVEEVVDDLKL